MWQASLVAGQSTAPTPGGPVGSSAPIGMLSVAFTADVVLPSAA